MSPKLQQASDKLGASAPEWMAEVVVEDLRRNEEALRISAALATCISLGSHPGLFRRRCVEIHCALP